MTGAAVAPPDRDLVRKLAVWATNGLPVTSLYLDVDGRRYLRTVDYLGRAEAMVRRAHVLADEHGHDNARSAHGDAYRIWRFFREDFERKGIRGVAVFSCSGAGLWQEVRLSHSVRDRMAVRASPYVLPLETLLEEAETFCTALVDREKARLLVSSLGEIDEVTSVLDEVPGRHDQGGWAQARHQRHIEDHVLRHIKRVAEALLRLRQGDGFDHLVLAGSDECVAELERELHDYVRRTIVDRVTLPMSASAEEVLELTTELEREMEKRREEEAVARVESETSSGTGRAVAGTDATLAALEAGRIETLVVSSSLEASGVRCTSCGHLDTAGATCAACGARTEQVTDLVEEAVESALRRGCRVETVAASASLTALGGIGALLRF